MDNILPLMHFLRQESNLTQEGLFRKYGNLNRQQALKDQLNAGKDITSGSEDNLFNAHDVANLLKTYLTELPEPILQERYYSAYCQVLDMVDTNLEPNMVELKRSNQLRENLLAILDLLHKVIERNEDERNEDVRLGTWNSPWSRHSCLQDVWYRTENSPY